MSFPITDLPVLRGENMREILLTLTPACTLTLSQIDWTFRPFLRLLRHPISFDVTASENVTPHWHIHFLPRRRDSVHAVIKPSLIYHSDGFRHLTVRLKLWMDFLVTSYGLMLGWGIFISKFGEVSKALQTECQVPSPDKTFPTFYFH